MSIFGPAWFVNKGLGIGNLKTCDTLFSSKSVMYSVLINEAFHDNPAYVPINSGGLMEGGDNRLSNNAESSSGFTRWISPSRYRDAVLKINGNGITTPGGENTPFSIWLARDGPVPDGGFPDPPVKTKKLFTIPLTTDPSYPSSGKFFIDNLNIEMFSGHSYGYIFEMDTTPTLPTTGTLTLSIGASVYFGAAGA